MNGLASNLSLTIPLDALVALPIFQALGYFLPKSATDGTCGHNAPGGPPIHGRPAHLLSATTIERFASDWGWPS